MSDDDDGGDDDDWSLCGALNIHGEAMLMVYQFWPKWCDYTRSFIHSFILFLHFFLSLFVRFICSSQFTDKDFLEEKKFWKINWCLCCCILSVISFAHLFIHAVSQSAVCSSTHSLTPALTCSFSCTVAEPWRQSMWNLDPSQWMTWKHAQGLPACWLWPTQNQVAVPRLNKVFGTLLGCPSACKPVCLSDRTWPGALTTPHLVLFLLVVN